MASSAEAGGVGLVTTAKTIPPATVAVIDPESGTSSGSGTTDVRIAVGDVILFRFRYFPVPQQQIQGINGWLTEYVPPNLQVVGVRLMDENGLTIPPELPGLAEDGTAVMANNWGGTPCSGGTCPPPDGGIAQLYGDTGIFFSTDPRTARNPSNAFITLQNGLVYPDPAVIGGDSNLRAALGVASPFRAHNSWDQVQVRLFGARGGNTPHLFGSPVAGPQTHYRYEATETAGVPGLRYVVGPWQRVRYPRLADRHRRRRDEPRRHRHAAPRRRRRARWASTSRPTTRCRTSSTAIRPAPTPCASRSGACAAAGPSSWRWPSA
ncbi:MAG: hypothetical protein M5U28_54255 [Sandaracinaceae bacterium]|nr:hypothetical protein [Sandaracinaceae bacterium]